MSERAWMTRRGLGRGLFAGFVVVAACAAFAAFAAPQPLAGQDVDALAVSCAGTGSGPVQTACADAALGALALQHGYGLLMAAGGPFPASPSTAGNRLRGSPRWVLDLGTGWTSFRRPDLTDGQRTVRRTLAAAPRLSLAAGVYEGFAPGSTLGGMGAIDVVGELRLLPVPAVAGLSGRVVSWGVGARVGIVRESFTLPGVTLTLMHRRAGSMRYPDDPEPQAEANIQPHVSSLRAVVGKDLWDVGVSGGLQWDRIRGDARATARVGGETFNSGAVALPASRSTWFVGLNRTWVVTQLTAEFGWSPSPGGEGEARGTGPFRAPSSSLTGALSFRITY